MGNSIMRATSLTVLYLGLAGSAAQATVIGATPGASLQGGAMFVLGDGAARFTFASTGPTGNAAVAIQTGGAARIYSAPVSSGAPSTYIAGTGGFVIDANFATGTFEKLAQPTRAPFSRGDTFYVLGLDLSDGLHYGYARTDNDLLESFAYQSVAGQGLHTGASAEQAPGSGNPSVPEPENAVFLGFGLLLIGAGWYGRRSARG